MFKNLNEIFGRVEDLHSALISIAKEVKEILHDFEELPSDETELDTEKDEN